MSDHKDGPQDEEDEARLWRAAMREVKPLKGQDAYPAAPKPAITKKAPAASGQVAASDSKPVRSRAVVPAPSSTVEEAAHPSLGLDKRTRSKIKKGQMPIEGRLDLHGMGQARAHEALNIFIFNAYEAGKRQVLVITGKGRAEDGGLRSPIDKGYGVLKRRVPEWLATAPLKDMVLKVHTAQPRHGGEGALYVYLRRKR